DLTRLMASLRPRVLASVLLLSAAGLVLLAAVTYAEQRSFLQERVDQEVRAAGPALSQALDNAGLRPTSNGQLSVGSSAAGGGGLPRVGPRGKGPNLNLPPGTYGQRRNAQGKVLGNP